jgi:hypothetical protein
MKRVKGVEDLNICIIGAQGIVDVGAVNVLSCLFRRLFLEGLQALHAAGELKFFTDLAKLNDPRAFGAYLAPLRHSEWVVYAKRPFAGPKQVLAYLARYTHRVAISNSRLLSLSEGHVRFRWKDYRDDKTKVMTLQSGEFIRRFLLHVLPDGFHRFAITACWRMDIAQRSSRSAANCLRWPRHRTVRLTKKLTPTMPSKPIRRHVHVAVAGCDSSRPSTELCPDCPIPGRSIRHDLCLLFNRIPEEQ